MSWQYGLLFDSAEQFLEWLKGKLKSKITEVHVHHTYQPDHSDFNGSNHRQLQDGMRNYHVNARGFSDIAQHITIFPDGKIMTGRNVNQPPASATGYNDSDNDGQHPFMFEMLGNFDVGRDKLEGKQLESAVKVTRFFYEKGAIIRFHREMANKTCPGSGVDKNWFVSLVKQSQPVTTNPSIPTTQAGWDPNPEYHRLLKLTNPMMRGADVKRVQEKLGITADGIFGPQTKQAVMDFQRKNGLTVDGIVGPKTWNALFPTYAFYDCVVNDEKKAIFSARNIDEIAQKVKDLLKKQPDKITLNKRK